MAEKWERKWGNNQDVYNVDSGVNFIHDFAKIVLERNIKWRKYEKSIYMPKWSDVEDEQKNVSPTGRIKEIENTEWSYFIVDWFNYANATQKDPASWNATGSTLKDTPIREHFDKFVRESLKHIFKLAGRKSDDSTIQSFIKRHFSDDSGLIGSSQEHVIQFGDYTVEARGNNEVSNAVSPGLRFLVGIKTKALKRLPHDRHIFGGSPGYARYFEIDPKRSLKIKIGDIDSHFDEMARLLEFYQTVELLAASPEGGLYIPKTRLMKTGATQNVEIGSLTTEQKKKHAVQVDLGAMADDVRAFGQALKELADKSSRTPITYFMPKRAQDAKDEDIDIATVMKSDKWKDDPSYYDDKDITTEESDADFASLKPDQIARTADNRFGKDGNILEVYFTKGEKTVVKWVDGYPVKYVPPEGTRVLMVTEYVPEKEFSSEDVSWDDLDQAGALAVGRLGKIRGSDTNEKGGKRILLTHLSDFRNDEAVQSEMVVNFLYKIHHYSNVCKGPTDNQEAFANFLKTGDRKKLLETVSFQKFVEEYIYNYQYEYLKEPKPQAVLNRYKNAEQARLDTNPSTNEDDEKEDFSLLADQSWSNKYEKYYSAEAFTNSADSIMMDIVGGPTPPRVRLGGMPHPISGIYKQVLNNADVKTLAIKMIRCLSPDRWLELLCRYIFENMGIDGLLESLRKSGLLESLMQANKDFGKVVNQVQQSKAVQQTEYVKLEHEKEQYNQEILRLVELRTKVQKEIPTDSAPTPKQQERIDNINNEINDYEGRRQLVELDEYSAKYNASAGSYLPISHEQAEEAKRASRETARIISNLSDPNLKDKICKNILKYAIDFAEMIYNSSQSQKGTKDSIEKIQKEGEKGKGQPNRFQQPAWPELPSDPITHYARELLNKFITWQISSIVTETLKYLLKEIWEWCRELQDPEDDRPRRPGQANFRDLLEDNPDEAAQAMCQILDQYGFTPEACDVEDFSKLLSDIELLLSAVEICDLFKGKPDPNVAQYVRNLLEVRYPGIFQKISRGERYAIDAAIANFFKQFENLLEDGYCEDLTVSLAEIDQNFTCCMPMPAQQDARCYLLQDWLTEEGLNNCIEEAEEEQYNSLSFALDLAAGKNPVDTPPIWCDGEREGILPHDVEPLGFINENLLDMVFHPIEATFRSDFHLFMDKYLKLAGSEAETLFANSVVPTDDNTPGDILKALQGGMSNMLLGQLKEDFNTFIPDITDINDQKYAATLYNIQKATDNEELMKIVDVPDKIMWKPNQGTIFEGNEIFSDNTYEIKIDNPLGAEGRIIYQLSPNSADKYTITITWKDKDGDDFFYSYLVDAGKINWSAKPAKLLGSEDPTLGDNPNVDLVSLDPTLLKPSLSLPGDVDTNSNDSNGNVMYSKMSDTFVDFFIGKLSPFPHKYPDPWSGMDISNTKTPEEKIRELFNNMTISVMERFAFAASQSKFFDITPTRFRSIFSSMVPQQVFPVGETCHPENDASLIRVKAFKQYAKSRSKDIDCAVQRRWPGALKQYDKMGQDAPSLSVATAEAIVLTLLRLYSVEAVMKTLPMMFTVGYDGIIGDEVVEFLVELVLEDLKSVDEVATPTINSKIHDKNPAIVEIEPYTSERLGKTSIEEPPQPAASPRRYAVPISKTYDPKTWRTRTKKVITIPGHIARYPGDGKFPRIPSTAIVNHVYKSGPELVENEDGRLSCPPGVSSCITNMTVLSPPQIEFAVEPFVPKYQKHVLRYANQIMKNRTKKIELDGGQLFSEGKPYPSSNFEDLYGLNGIRFLMREQLLDTVKYFKDKVNNAVPNAYVEDIKRMWLRMLEFDGISVPTNWKRVSDSNLLVDAFPRASNLSDALSRYDGAGRFFEFKTKTMHDQTFNIFAPTDFYDQVKGGGFVLQPYIRASMHTAGETGTDFINLTEEEREKIRSLLIEKRVRHYLDNPKLLDPDYQLPKNYDISKHAAPMDFIGGQFPAWTTTGINRHAYLYPGGEAWKNWFGRTDDQDHAGEIWGNRSCLGFTENTPVPAAPGMPISNLGLNREKWTDSLGNRAERILIGFLWNDPWVQSMWTPDGNKVEGIDFQEDCWMPGGAGWCTPKAKIEWSSKYWWFRKHKCALLGMQIGYRKNIMAIVDKLQKVVYADVEKTLTALEEFTFNIEKAFHGDINLLDPPGSTFGEGIYFNLQEWNDLFGTDAFSIWLTLKKESKTSYQKYFNGWSYGLRLAYILPETPGKEFSDQIDGQSIMGAFSHNTDFQTLGWNANQVKKTKKAFRGVEYVYPPTTAAAVEGDSAWYQVAEWGTDDSIEEQLFDKVSTTNDETGEVNISYFLKNDINILTGAKTHAYYEVPFAEVETPVAGGLDVELDYFITINAWEDFPYQELFEKMISNNDFNILFNKINNETPGLISLNNISTMMTFYTLMSTDKMPQFKEVFLNTKRLLRENFYTVLNAQRYEDNPKVSSSESAALGMPNFFGPVMATAAMFAAATPVSILKGLVTLIDPNWKKYPWTPAGWVAYFLNKTDKNPWFGDLEDETLVCPEKTPEPDENIKMLRKIMTKGGVSQKTQDAFFKYFADDESFSITSAFYTAIETYGDTFELQNKLSPIFELLDEYILAYEDMVSSNEELKVSLRSLVHTAVNNLEYGGSDETSDWPLNPTTLLWEPKNGDTILKMPFGALASEWVNTNEEVDKITVPYRVQKIVLKEIIRAYEFKHDEYFKPFLGESPPGPSAMDYVNSKKMGPGDTAAEHFPSNTETIGELPFAKLRDDINEYLLADPVVKKATLTVAERYNGKTLADYKTEDDLPSVIRLKTKEGYHHTGPNGNLPVYLRPKAGFKPCTKDGGCYNVLVGDEVRIAWLGAFDDPSSYEVSWARVPYYDYLYWDGETTYPGLIIQAMTVWNNLKSRIQNIPPCEDLADIVENYGICTAKFKLETAMQFFDQVAGKINSTIQDPEGLGFGELDFSEEKPIPFWDASGEEFAEAMMSHIDSYFDELISTKQASFYNADYDPLIGEGEGGEWFA